MLYGDFTCKNYKFNVHQLFPLQNNNISCDKYYDCIGLQLCMKYTTFYGAQTSKILVLGGTSEIIQPNVFILQQKKQYLEWLSDRFSINL